MRYLVILVPALLSISACSGGNLKSVSDYSAPAAPPVRHAVYNPFATYGSSNATWTPPVNDRHGTIVRPVDPSLNNSRPDYEHADWATGAAGGDRLAPPGTF